MRLVRLLIVALVLGATSPAGAGQPTTYVYILLGGFAGADGYMDSSGLLLLARRIAWIPSTWVETYNWADWVTAANRIWALPSEDTRVVVIGYSGGGSRATWLANSILHKRIDLIVTYDPSPSWQMQNLPPNVKKAITYQNQRRFFLGLGGGELTGPNVQRFQITEPHLAVQFDERLHQITLQAIEDIAKQQPAPAHD
ncbi:MAG TPA: hypothetical protein VH678_17510 [Xanthobacteraceae bacterium]|jgi:pimeloyl-ACP methyl ester carboxylesterase